MQSRHLYVPGNIVSRTALHEYGSKGLIRYAKLKAFVRCPPSSLSGTAEHTGMKSTAAYLLFTPQGKKRKKKPGESQARVRVSEIDGKRNKDKQRYMVSLERWFLRLCVCMTELVMRNTSWLRHG